MCGIVGYIGPSEASGFLLQGLKQLEYRGYDSAGIATLDDSGTLARRRAPGKLKNLAQKLEAEPLQGHIGIGHTRWATHGGPSERNAHPHMSAHVAVVHNGIIENYAALRAELAAFGYIFETETDTEVIVHLLSHCMKQKMTPSAAMAEALRRLEGSFALAVIFACEPARLFTLRRGAPLVVGHGVGEMFVASDAQALAPFTSTLTYLEDGDRAEIWADGVLLIDSSGAEVTRPVRHSSVSAEDVGKGPFAHFMLKEIYEQPVAVAATLDALRHPTSGGAGGMGLVADLSRTLRLTISGCGTAYFAGAVAKYWFEEIAGLSVELDIASEFRYRHPPLPTDGVALFLSQSGETLDTVEALRLCKRAGQHILSIVNKPESTIARESDQVFYTQAGPEIGVASTKAFTTQLAALACLVLAVARQRGRLEATREKALMEGLAALPGQMSAVLDRADKLKELAVAMASAKDALYLGRNVMAPIAMEGALKLKEISYIHAEGFPAGELKHGPLALVDDTVPVVVIAPSGILFEKMAGNMREVAARGGKVLLVSDADGIAALGSEATWTFTMPACASFAAPMLYALPMQLLAYHVALLKGTDVDQPRNLAKSVTVE